MNIKSQTLVFLTTLFIGGFGLKHCTIKSLERHYAYDHDGFYMDQYKWNPECNVFHGDLSLSELDYHSLDFSKLFFIHGTLRIVGTELVQLPSFPNLRMIHVMFVDSPALVIMNNKHLRDIHGLTNFLKYITSADFPVLVDNNENLDTSVYQKFIFSPYESLASERQLAPGYSRRFSEGFTLTIALGTVALGGLLFAHALSFGSLNIYFVPGYQKF